ncbi:MAG: QueT transporter family protein [Acholeplasma sp.]|nr:QueT transporter family protein [Acholeplasma sp.]
MFHFTLKDWIKQSLIAALYVSLVFAFIPISFGEVQFRVAEILLILVFFDKKVMIGLTIGTFVANFFTPASPMLPFDLTLGVLATFLSLLTMITIKNKYIALFAPSVFNGLLVGLSLYLAFGTPLYLGMPSVFIGEFVVTYVVGLPLYKVLQKNTGFKELFEK